MTKTPEQVCTLLDADLSRSAVKSRSQGGANLSYVDTYYVIKRLNECFGNLGWDSETVAMVEVPGNTDRNGKQLVAYRAMVRITATVAVDGGGYMKIVKEGTGWGSDKSTLNPHEMASKEAESDALKRAAMKFGMSLGLALYDKSQENVGDSEPKIPKGQEALYAALSAKPATPQAVAPTPAGGDVTPKEGGREALNKRITAMSKVVIAKRLKTIDELKADMKSKYGADSTAGLDDSEAKDLLATLEGLANAPGG